MMTIIPILSLTFLTVHVITIEAFTRPPVLGPYKNAISNHNRHVRMKAQTDNGKDNDGDPSTPIPMVPEGGPSLIFQMARRMQDLIGWDDSQNPPTDFSPDFSPDIAPPPLPRWRPHPSSTGISNENSSFRSKPPPMNSYGYLSTIRRNSRKRNKPALWRYALSSYYRMRDSPVLSKNKSDVHDEAAMTACSKLGLWREALEIFEDVEEVTERMVLALVKACVRGSKKETGREALDAVTEKLDALELSHGISLTAIHLNPVASAYQSLSLYKEAESLLKTYLKDPVFFDPRQTTLNVNNFGAKNEATFSIIVKGAVTRNDWAGAVEGLRNMTESGLYPDAKRLTEWKEAGERRSGRKGMKKRREKNWIRSNG